MDQTPIYAKRNSDLSRKWNEEIYEDREIAYIHHRSKTKTKDSYVSICKKFSFSSSIYMSVLNNEWYYSFPSNEEFNKAIQPETINEIRKGINLHTLQKSIYREKENDELLKILDHLHAKTAEIMQAWLLTEFTWTRTKNMTEVREKKVMISLILNLKKKEK